MPILAKDWYEPNPDLTSFYQGDIVLDVPVIFLPDKISQWFILRPSLKGAKQLDDVLRGEICRWFEVFPEGQLKDAWKASESRDEFVAAKANKKSVIILTQSCDLVNRGYYQVAPVYAESKEEKNLQYLRENGLNYTFYLPASSPHISENSYADLSHTTLVPKRYFAKNLVGTILAARLTALAITKLQEQIATYFGRPFGFSRRDKSKTGGEYVCISCFYRRTIITKMRFETDANFSECTTCGDTRWLRVVPSEQQPQPNTEPVVHRNS